VKSTVEAPVRAPRRTPKSTGNEEIGGIGLLEQVRRQPTDVDRDAEMLSGVPDGRVGRRVGRKGRIEISDHAN
jgi:hypothetical protein